MAAELHRVPQIEGSGTNDVPPPLELPEAVLRCDSPVLLCGPVEASAPRCPGLCVLWSKLSWDAHEPAGRGHAGREQTPSSSPRLQKAPPAPGRKGRRERNAFPKPPTFSIFPDY